jgi:hypothetical protein
MAKIGRPRIEINQNEFEKLCQMQCTLNEIAGWFNCSEDTIENWCKSTYNMIFSDIYKKKSAGGKISLRRTQFKLAEKNATMAIFLGKQYLGQRDNPDLTDIDMSKIDDLLGALKDEANK